MRRASAVLFACLAAAVAAHGQSLPESDYALQCQGCHGASGAGVPGHVPPLTGVAALLATPAGRTRLLAVPGVRGASLSDERLARLLEWTAMRFGPATAARTFAPLEAAEVGRLR